ncbi:hypothetical protein [Paraburkholderia dipogonis]|uniref:hypothetical protein n=1 Tax=Paraburkholderia dipogonis TaxID=1211383 RepID=UPI0038B983BC
MAEQHKPGEKVQTSGIYKGESHRIRRYELLANPVRRENLAKVRDLMHVAPRFDPPSDDFVIQVRPAFICRHCGAPMIVIDIVRAHCTHSGATNVAGRNMNATVLCLPDQTSALRQRGLRADVCACRFMEPQAHPLHARHRAKAPHRPGAWAIPASRLDHLARARLRMPGYQSP